MGSRRRYDITKPVDERLRDVPVDPSSTLGASSVGGQMRAFLISKRRECRGSNLTYIAS